MYCGKYQLNKDLKERKKLKFYVGLPEPCIGLEILELKKYFLDSFLFDKYDIIKFEDAANVVDRIEFCEQLIVKSTVHPKTIPSGSYKVDTISFTNIALAKNFTDIGDIRLAFVFINAAINYAATDECMAGCYYERAERFFKSRMWVPCYESIQLAKEKGVVKEIIGRVDKMLEIVTYEINDLATKLPRPPYPSTFVDVPKLHCQPQPGLTYVDKCIGIKYDQNGSGCQMIANSNFSAGEIIIIEENMCQTLIRDAQYSRCDFCFKECDLNLVPCKYCVSSMYCNNLNAERHCANEAWESYHKYECPINEILYAIHPYKTIVRLIITSFLTDKDIDDFIKFTNSDDYEKFNAFTMDWSNPPHNYIVKLFYKQKSGESIRTNGDRFIFSRMAAYLIILLTDRTTLIQERFNTPFHLNFLREFIYRSILISSMNSTFASASSTIRFTYGDQTFSMYGCNIRAFQPTFQHNCKANLAVLSYGLNKSVIYTQRPVKSGESLTIDYVRLHLLDDRAEVLKLQYNYACDCIINLKNTKFISYALRRDHHVDFDITESCTKLYLANRKVVIKLKEMCCKYLTEHDNEYPTYELYTHCFVLEKCFQRLYGMPILHEAGKEQYFNYFDKFWVHANEQLDMVYDHYKKQYKNGDKIYRHLFEFVKNCVIYKEDAYYPRNPIKNSIDDVFGITVPSELKYFQQFGDLPGNYHLQQSPNLIYALLMLNEVCPNLITVYTITPYFTKPADMDQFIHSFREFLKSKNLLDDNDDDDNDDDADNGTGKYHQRDGDKRHKKKSKKTNKFKRR